MELGKGNERFQYNDDHKLKGFTYDAVLLCASMSMFNGIKPAER